MAGGPVAKFRADFSDFTRQVREGIRSVEELQQASGVSEAGIQKLTRAFSGERIIRDAREAATAVERIGGASRLTEAEQARVNRTVTEALAKYKALGVEAPADLRRLAEQTTVTANKTDQLTSSTSLSARATGAFTQSLGQLTAAFSLASLIDRAVSAVVSFGAQAFESAGQLVDLRNSTGLSLRLLQEFREVAEQGGTTLEAFATAAYMLGVRLASNADRVEALGLSYETLRRMSPDDQFRAVIRALEAVDDQQKRNEIGNELFGRSWKEISKAVEKGYTDIANAARVSTDAQIEALERAGDRYTKFKRDVASAFSSAIGNYFLARDEFSRLTDEQKAHFHALQKGLGDAQGYLLKLANERLDKEKAAQQQETTRNEITRDYVKELEAQTTKMRQLTPATIQQIEAAQRMGASEEDLIRQFGVSGTVLRLLADDQKATAKATSEHERETKKAEEASRKFRESVKDLRVYVQTLVPALDDGSEALRNLAQGFQADGTLISESLAELSARKREEQKETEAWARANNAYLMPALQSQAVSLEQATEAGANWRAGLRDLSAALAQLAEVSGPLGGVVKGLASMVARANVLEEGTARLSEGFSALKDSGYKSAAAFVQMAASVATLSAAFIQAITTGNTFQRTLAGMQAGAQIGAMFGPMGTAIGAVVGGLSGLISGLTGVSEETKKVRGEIADFETALRKNLTATQAAEAAGRGWAATTIAVRDAYVLTGRSAAEAEAIVKQLWDDKNPAAARAAIEQINKVLEEATRIAAELDKELNGALSEAVEFGVRLPEELSAAIESLIAMGKITGENAALFAALTADSQGQFRAMEEAAKKYGVELSALGPAFAQNRLNQQAADIINAFDTMTRNGADLSGVIAGMSDEINAFVAEAIKSGRTVPANMRPILEAMIEQGRLTDENGNKLEDLSGINFGDPVESAFDRIIKKLQELIDKISGGMGFPQATQEAQDFARRATDAIRAIPTQVDVEFTGRRDSGEASFATGTKGRTGKWFANFGAGTPAMLHGDEAVVPRGQADEFAAAVGGGQPGLAAELAGLRADFQLLPQLLARAVRDAVLVAG